MKPRRESSSPDALEKSSSADPLETSPPRFSRRAAERGAARVFGISGAVTPLDSERDQNFKIVTPGGESFVLKISNPADDRAALDMQTRAMLHIGRWAPGLPVMRPLPSSDGDYMAEAEDDDGRNHVVRLFTFLPGGTVQAGGLDAVDLQAFGSVVAQMGVALRGFFHPAGGYRILWDLKHAANLRSLLRATRDGSRRRLLEEVLDRFDDRVSSVLPALRAQLIHNDLTLDNVLMDEAKRVSGIVDFGDLTHTAVICDLAIALVSVMWERNDPLDAAEATIEGYRAITSIEEAEAAILGDLIAARLTSLVAIANWRVQRYPENTAYIMASVESAWSLLTSLEKVGWSALEERMRAACEAQWDGPNSGAHPEIDELLARRQRVLGPALSPLTYDRPLYLVRGRGSRMFDHAGRSYLDAYNNVPVVGHCHPRVTAAIAQQSQTLNTNTRYLHESVVELAERLVSTMPEGLDTVMFFNSGSEANDIAWRLATTYTRGTGAIVTEWAYHGVTTATTALSPEAWPDGDQPHHVETIPAPTASRARSEADDAGVQQFGSRVEEAIASLSRRGIRPAAFFVDALFTSDGVYHPPASYLQDAVRRLREAGCLIVADEVQCGYGRAGTDLWSFQASDVTPDFVTLGKPMGNGHPVAAVVTRAEIAERFASETDMFSTFGGNPVACRAALAVLDVIEEEELQRRALEVGEHLRAGLGEIEKTHDSIAEVRGAGLLVGVELVDPETRQPVPASARAVIGEMKDRGVLIGSTGRMGNVLKIRPPLVVTKSDADVIISTLGDCIAAV